MNALRLASSATPVSPDLGEVLARGDVWRGDMLATLPGATVASGYAALDAELPGGGWPQGQLTELLAAQTGVGELSLLLPALGQLSAAGGWLALVAPPCLPHAPAWAAAGVALERLLIVHEPVLDTPAPSAGRGRLPAGIKASRSRGAGGRPTAPGSGALWALEQLLASGGFAAVLGWCASEPDPRSLRRLQVAAEGRPVFAGLWRSPQAAASPSPAPLRLALKGAGVGRLAVQVLKRRGRPAARPLLLDLLHCPGSKTHVMAGPELSLVSTRSPVAQPFASLSA